MTRKQVIILEALQEARQNLNSIKNALGIAEDNTLIDFLKEERKLEFDNYKLWISRAKKQLNHYNVNTDFRDKIKPFLNYKSKDTTINYMM